MKLSEALKPIFEKYIETANVYSFSGDFNAEFIKVFPKEKKILEESGKKVFKFIQNSGRQEENRYWFNRFVKPLMEKEKFFVYFNKEKYEARNMVGEAGCNIIAQCEIIGPAS